MIFFITAIVLVSIAILIAIMLLITEYIATKYDLDWTLVAICTTFSLFIIILLIFGCLETFNIIHHEKVFNHCCR